MANNVITATYSSSNITYTKPAYQYDYGMILQFSGIDLPQAYEVHFSNTEFCGESISQIGDETGVTIPDEMFLSGAPIYAWTFLHTDEDDGETVYKTVISINKRAQPSDIEPTPVQQDAITQAIAALNVAVEQTAADVVAAGESAEAAAGSAETAGQAKDDAVEAKDKAVEAKNAAETAQGKAEDAQTAAETAQGKAEDAQSFAEGFAGDASQFASDAQGYASDAQGYAQGAEQAAGSVLGLTADATVDANVGTPSVEVQVTTESDHKNMSFSFRNIKGEPFTYDDFTEAQKAELVQGPILSAQTSAIQAVDAKGQEVIESIPADYSTLSEDVDNLKIAFIDNKKGILTYNLVPNSYVERNGTITSYNNWKRTDYTYIGDCDLLIAKTSASSNYNCFYDSSKTFIKSFAVGTSDTKIVVPENAEYVIFSNTNAGMDNLSVSFVSKVQSDIDSIENRLVSDEYEINAVRSAFENNITPFALSAFTSGKYIDNNGAEQSNSSMSYTSCAITDDDVGKTIYISGSAWYAIKPFVFVGTSGNIVRSMVDDAGSNITQYTDLVFKPVESGTLYINRYASGSNVQLAKAYYNAIGILAENSFSDAIAYTPVPLGNLISGRLVSAVTGEITETQSTTQNITDYIEVTGNTYYLVTTQMYYGYGMYVWYDEDKNYISGRKAESGSARTQMYCERVKSPSNASYLIIGFLYETSFMFPFLMKGKMNAAYPSKRWSGLKWTGIGDSLTEAYSVTGAHYFDLICAATGISFVNKGVSGTGYAKGTSNFMTRALTVDSDSDVVTFFGSGNDASSELPLGTATDTGTETIGGCINTAINNLYSVMPVVQLGIVTPTPWQGNMPSDNGWMARYSALIVEICNRRSIPCLDLFHCSNLNPNSAEVRQIAYARDNGGGVHPSEVGHAIIAPRFLAFLESLLMH